MKTSAGSVISTAGALAAAVLLVGVTPDAALAYRTNGKWASGDLPVPYRINSSGMRHGPEVVKQAAALWGNKREFAFAFRYQGTTNQRNGDSSVNSVYMSSNIGRGVLGLTMFNFGGRTFSHFDIALRPGLSRLTFFNTAIHEFGHAVGLGHSEYGAAIMNAGGGSGDRLTDLHSDDIQGAAYLYPPRQDRPWADSMGPPKPDGLSPKGEVNTRQPAFTWNAVQGAVRYQLSIDKVGADRSRTNLVLGQKVETNRFVPEALAPGTHWWWVRAIDAKGKTSEWTWAELTVTDTTPIPGPPSLIAPTGTIETHTPSFRWSAVDHATHYELAVDHVAEGTNTQTRTLRTGPLSGTTHQAASALAPGKYFWWVRARNAVGASSWSHGTFTLEKKLLPAQPNLLSPDGTVATQKPSFSWEEAAGADSYELVIQHMDDEGTRHEVLRVENVQQPLYQLVNDLDENTPYYWWVRGHNENGAGEWSEYGQLVITLGDDVPLEAPTLLAPLALTQETKPVFSWTAVDEATHYELRVDEANGPIVLERARLSGTSEPASGRLEPGKTYFWWVRAWKGQVPGDWSAGSFKVTRDQGGRTDALGSAD